MTDQRMRRTKPKRTDKGKRSHRGDGKTDGRCENDFRYLSVSLKQDFGSNSPRFGINFFGF